MLHRLSYSQEAWILQCVKWPKTEAAYRLRSNESCTTSMGVISIHQNTKFNATMGYVYCSNPAGIKSHIYRQSEDRPKCGWRFQRRGFYNDLIRVL